MVEGVEVSLSLLLSCLRKHTSISISISISIRVSMTPDMVMSMRLFSEKCLPHETFPADNYLCGHQWDRLNKKLNLWIKMVVISSTFEVKVDVHVFAKSATVIISVGLRIPK